jgi:DNA-damage-inducible protein J
MKDTSVRVRVDSHLKKEVVNILNRLGLNMSEVVNAMFAQIKLQKGVPFNVRIPNKTTLKAIEAVEKRKTFKARSVKELMDELR